MKAVEISRRGRSVAAGEVVVAAGAVSVEAVATANAASTPSLTAASTASTTALPLLPEVNGVALQTADERITIAELRQRACTELLRQAAIDTGRLAADDPPPQAGAISEAAAEAIEGLLDAALTLPEPDERACRRHHAAHGNRYAVGEQVLARHVLFAVTPGIDINALRSRAENCLLDLRANVAGRSAASAAASAAGGEAGGEAASDAASEAAGADRFATAAAANSNCPSGREGGQLGWLSNSDCSPEFARELFGRSEIGVLPRLVHSRFGLHVVEVQARRPGVVPPFQQVRAAVAQSLRQQSFATALSQYLRLLAGQARVVGVDLGAVDSPLVQ